MSQLSFSSFDASLMVRDAQGRYLLATADQILEAARQAIEQKMQRGASFSSPAAVKEYLRAKLAGFEHEVFAVLFLDTQHRLIEYAEMFRGTIDSASVYPRELVKEALRLNAAAVILSHNHPSGSPCRVPDDWLLKNKRPLLHGREVLREVLATWQARAKELPC